MALLITAAEVRTFAASTISGTGLDASLLEPLIAKAQALIATELLYPTTDDGTVALDSAEYVIHMTGRVSGHRHRLMLPFDRHRITEIDEVMEDSTGVFAAATEVASTDYNFRAAKGELFRFGSVWSPAEESIRVTFTAGWTAQTVPEEVKTAIMQTVAHLLRLKSDLGKSSTSIPGGGTTSSRDETLPESVVQAVAGWKLMPW